MLFLSVDDKLERLGYIKQIERDTYVKYKKLVKSYNAYHVIEATYLRPKRFKIRTYFENRNTDEVAMDAIGVDSKILKLILKKVREMG